ncbi:metalloregulator ArsR/SmtB family transcription factor [uncultured Parasphingorhabdus sp.]|uniref:ArsR/SmtB family transcription factor n=1 Tax=uncultured Parasphingorhabdus sp. TaxID=2709694 RepID=UPI0030D84E9D|tara:strand:- start:28838 stop:29176 length:339 start_codon:yes stop_codon:yes gene_type:complete
MSDVFSALADETRRLLLDRLFNDGGQSLSALCANLDMSRQAVAKHLGILEKANLVSVHWQGREKLHYLNPVPLGDIVHRWVGKFEDARIEALIDFKEQIEKPDPKTQEKRRA